MEVVQVLHMNGGMGDTSYANNSLVQVIKLISNPLPASLYVYKLTSRMQVIDIWLIVPVLRPMPFKNESNLLEYMKLARSTRTIYSPLITAFLLCRS